MSMSAWVDHPVGESRLTARYTPQSRGLQAIRDGTADGPTLAVEGKATLHRLFGELPQAPARHRSSFTKRHHQLARSRVQLADYGTRRTRPALFARGGPLQTSGLRSTFTLNDRLGKPLVNSDSDVKMPLGPAKDLSGWVLWSTHLRQCGLHRSAERRPLTSESWDIAMHDLRHRPLLIPRR
jgi:hypothetical protein